MKRYLDQQIANDLNKKLVILTGPRQVGKTTLSRQLLTDKDSFQYLNWDISSDRRILQEGSWSQQVPLLIFDEIHKMPNWKIWLKGIADSRLAQIANTDSQAQKILITGSARMDTFRQSGESLAGRYFSWRLHPISVKELVDFGGMNADQALDHLLIRGGFPEPCLAETESDANRWRQQYFTDLIREDILEFSRIQEVNTMRLFVEMLRDRVGSPLSLASLARDLSVTQPTLKKYLDILEALFIVFVIHPWHSNVARSLLKAPKVYFYDNAFVRGGPGIQFENAVASMLQKHVHFQEDSQGVSSSLHYIRTKDDVEVDFAISEDQALTHLIECKLSDSSLSSALLRFSNQFQNAKAVQLVKNIRQEEQRGSIQIAKAAGWLSRLSA
jgi:predicted AAA+ superfamily ATPase